MFFEAAGHQRHNVDGFYLHAVGGATLFGSHQHNLSPPVWQILVGFHLLRAAPGNETERKIYGVWVKSPVLF